MVKSLVPLTKEKNPYLPIVGLPNSYTMDVMFVNSFQTADKKKPTKSKKIVINSNTHLCALVLIETTSRKVFVYPLKNSKQETVFEAFEKFLDEIGFRISSLTMDSGKEYNAIINAYKDEDYFDIHQVIAAENMHTALSRVDRVIRTLKHLLYIYFSETGNYNWQKVLPEIAKLYNSTEHSSLKLSGKFYTPNEVWLSPNLANHIRDNDKKKRSYGLDFIRKYMKKGNKFNYVVNNTGFSKGSKKGMISNDIVTIDKQIGNSFKVKSSNPELDGKILPYRNLIPIKEGKERKKTKFNISNIKIYDKGEIKPIKRISPKKKHELDVLSTNYLTGKKENNIVSGKRKKKSKKIFDL